MIAPGFSMQTASHVLSRALAPCVNEPSGQDVDPGICACPATIENQHILDGRGRDRLPHRRVVEVKAADPALIQVNPGLGTVGAVNFDRIAAAMSVAAQAMAQVEHGGDSTAMQQSQRAMGASRTMIQKVRDTSSRQDHGGYTEQRKTPTRESIN
jgi:hypothetical protein